MEQSTISTVRSLRSGISLLQISLSLLFAFLASEHAYLMHALLLGKVMPIGLLIALFLCLLLFFQYWLSRFFVRRRLQMKTNIYIGLLSLVLFFYICYVSALLIHSFESSSISKSSLKTNHSTQP